MRFAISFMIDIFEVINMNENELEFTEEMDKIIENTISPIIAPHTIEEFKEELQSDRTRISMLNFSRAQQFAFSYEAAKVLAKATKARASRELPKAGSSLGSVSIEGKDVRFIGGKWFARIGEFADNMEVYPLANGGVRVTFGFYGVTKQLV